MSAVFGLIRVDLNRMSDRLLLSELSAYVCQITQRWDYVAGMDKCSLLICSSHFQQGGSVFVVAASKQMQIETQKG